jgi:hypothetical protein
MNKQERIKAYNESNEGYNITGIKQVSAEHLQWLRLNSAKTLGELYQTCSDTKWNSYNSIMSTYDPKEVIGLVGNSMSYSITLVASNGDILWITKANNYLLEVA